MGDIIEDSAGQANGGRLLIKAADLNEMRLLITNLPILCIEDETSKLEISFERFVRLADSYQLQPHLLDSSLKGLIDNLISIIKDAWKKEQGSITSSIEQPFAYLSHLAKVRGPKIFINRLPHEVDDFEIVLSLFEANEKGRKNSEVRYVSLLWLTLLCKLPFDFTLLLPEDGGGANVDAKLVQIATDSLFEYADKSKQASCMLIAEVLSRSASKEPANASFTLLTDTVNLALHKATLADLGAKSSSLLLLCSLFKRLNRAALTPLSILTLRSIFGQNFQSSKDTVLRKLAAKLTQRVGMVLLKPKKIDWLYKKEARFLLDKQFGAKPVSESIGFSGEGTKGVKNGELARDDVIETIGDAETVSGVQDIIDFLMRSLKDKDTVVRWSAAKGLGRVTSKLAFKLANDVIAALMTHFGEYETDACWHGACLALAELGRRGCLLPTQLPAVISTIIKALSYDKVVASYSVGAHVRDAACYACWSLARAFSASDLAPHVQPLPSALILVSLFDSEIRCRRAASAAFQELVGRLPTVFAHGLSIVGIIDYFSIGNINECYGKLSVEIGQLTEYRCQIFEHLFNVRMSHYDMKIRKLTAITLSKLCAFRSDDELEVDLSKLKQTCQSDDSFLRCGSLLALSQILTSYPDHRIVRNHSLDIMQIPDNLNRAGYLDGLGGDVTRLGVVLLIKALLELLNTNQFSSCLSLDWYRILSASFTLNEKATLTSEIRDHSIDALQLFAHKTVVFEEGPKNSILCELLTKLRSDVSEIEKIGPVIILGCCAPYFAAQTNHLEPYLSVLLDIVNNVNKTQIEHSVKLRSAAMEALVRIASNCTSLSKDTFRLIFNAQLLGFDDFTTSSQGDIGRLVRQSAIDCILKLMQLDPDAVYIDSDLIELSIGKLLETCFDKIEALQKMSFGALEKILTLKISTPYEHLRKVVSSINEESSMAENYTKLIKILALPTFSKFLLRGCVSAIGCLTDSISSSASEALLAYLSKADTRALEKFFSDLCGLTAEILETLRSNKDVRLILPMLKTLDVVISSNYFENYENATNLEKVLHFVNVVSSRSTNRQRITFAVSIYCSLLQFWALDDNLAKASLRILLKCLLHQFPFIRAKTADRLHEALLNYGQLDNHSETILSILSNTDWMSNDLDLLRDNVNEIELMLCFPDNN